MENVVGESLTPFSGELLSQKTLKEVQEMSSVRFYEGYNPNDDLGATELGGDVFEAPLGNGLGPLGFMVMMYVFRVIVKNKLSNKTNL